MAVAFLHHPFMSQAARQHFDSAALIDAMLRFELALADSEEHHGVLPAGTSDALRRHLSDHAFDLEDLEAGTTLGGNVAIPFVRQAKAALPEALRGHFHFAATSQDVLDSALMLLSQTRLPTLLSLTRRCLTALAVLMDQHRDTPMIGRTLMQQALPTTFGVRAAQWAWQLDEARARLDDLVTARLPVQFGGPVGIHNGLEDGLTIMETLAASLGLRAPLLPWHTDRQPIHALITALDALAVATDKIASDVALLAQSEIGELSEPAGDGVGGSSSMAHKRNPVRCALIRTAAHHIHGHTATVINAASQPLERGLGDWHSEWTPLIESQQLLEGALTQLAVLLEGLEVHDDVMAARLDAPGVASRQDADSHHAQIDRILAHLAR
ncbi:3-carboxy-cis,cis-muconate cycloisomerase [Kushneria avicenniae]|uniref:3-carboxy-cis,cis-muconate cycloisomerase n=1 Tax=Kushneria avicenniae TaxID=402385 RepID=A0A1I1JYI8_9GAMM|nr:lyase family protein [Kushneria avicenniae]SFC53759.1 3-carboxy-cis,cis-muconate cycloisomerase [Kushneria avicenniae]